MIYLIVDDYTRMSMLFLMGKKQLAQKYNTIVQKWLVHKMRLKTL